MKCLIYIYIIIDNQTYTMKNTTQIIDIFFANDSISFCTEACTEYTTVDADFVDILDTIPTERLETEDDFSEYDLTPQDLINFVNNHIPEAALVAVSIRSKVFKAAWYYFNKGIYETFSEALKAAWKKAKIMIALRAGIVTLKFRKTTGEIRTAVATLKLDTPYTPKAPAKYTPDVIKFFDQSVDGWRSARIERIIAA